MARRKTKKVKLSPKATLLLTVLVVIYTLARPYLVPSVSIDEVPEYVCRQTRALVTQTLQAAEERRNENAD